MRQDEKHWGGFAGWKLHLEATHSSQVVNLLQSVPGSGVGKTGGGTITGGRPGEVAFSEGTVSVTVVVSVTISVDVGTIVVVFSGSGEGGARVAVVDVVSGGLGTVVVTVTVTSPSSVVGASVVVYVGEPVSALQVCKSSWGREANGSDGESLT